MIQQDIKEGQQVEFRPEFSKHLIGIVFETVAFPDGRTVHVAHESQGGKPYVHLRTRIGKRGRWGYRLANVADLILLP